MTATELSGEFDAMSCSDSAVTSMRGRFAIVKRDIVRLNVSVFMGKQQGGKMGADDPSDRGG